MTVKRCKGARGANTCIADYEVSGDAKGAYCAECIVAMRAKGLNVRIVWILNPPAIREVDVAIAC